MRVRVSAKVSVRVSDGFWRGLRGLRLRLRFCGFD